MEYHEGKLDRRNHKPADEIVFIYDIANGELDIFHKGKADTILDLQTIFGKAVLELDELPEQNRPSFELESLKSGRHQFRYTPESGIADVRIKSMRFSVFTGSTKRLMLDADYTKHPDAIYESIAEVFKAGKGIGDKDPRIPLDNTFVTQVALQVTFQPEENKRPRTRSFTISYPHSCNLKYDELGIRIHQMLAESGVVQRNAEPDRDKAKANGITPAHAVA